MYISITCDEYVCISIRVSRVHKYIIFAYVRRIITKGREKTVSAKQVVVPYERCCRHCSKAIDKHSRSFSMSVAFAHATCVIYRLLSVATVVENDTETVREVQKSIVLVGYCK